MDRPTRPDGAPTRALVRAATLEGRPTAGAESCAGSRRNGRVPQDRFRLHHEEGPMKTHPRTAMLVAGLAVIVSACASTTLDMTWRDPTYEGRPFTKVLVVGSTDSAD